jgi:hypothetical protein
VPGVVTCSQQDQVEAGSPTRVSKTPPPSQEEPLCLSLRSQKRHSHGGQTPAGGDCHGGWWSREWLSEGRVHLSQ